MTRLLIVSDMTHYVTADGTVLGWGPTVEEIDQLAVLFTRIRHVAFLAPGHPPATALPYSAENVDTVLVPTSGGPLVRDKIGVARHAVQYLRVVTRELANTDAVHVRCPSSIGALTIGLLAARRRPRVRWIKYAGNWAPPRGEAISYRAQRLALRLGVARGAVTVNGSWPRQRRHIVSFINPTLTTTELALGRSAILERCPPPPIRLLHVGRVEEAKGIGRAIQVVAALAAAGHDVHLDVVGDGAERPRFEAAAATCGLEQRVTFHGWVPKPALGQFYGIAHVLLMPTSAEGFPKVIAEALAYGVAPVVGAVSSIPHVLGGAPIGAAVPPTALNELQAAVLALATPSRDHEDELKRNELSQRFTYRSYLADVVELFRDRWGLDLQPEASDAA